MELCLEFETSISVSPHGNLFLDLLCIFLNIARPMPFAFGGKKWKPELIRLIWDHITAKGLLGVAGEMCKAGSQEPFSRERLKSLYFCHVEKWQPKIKSWLGWFYHQSIAVAIWSSLIFLPSNLGPRIIPAIGLGWKQRFFSSAL